MMPVSPYLRVCQYIAFIVAIFSNSLLLYLIRIRADKAFGRYRIMMASFSIFSIVYATIEVLTQPVMHIHGSGSMFYVDSFLKDYYTVGIFIASVYCGMFAMCISVLATLFVYRYVMLCKQRKKWHNKNKSLFLWSIFPILFFFYDAFCMFLMAPTKLKRDYFRSTVMENYNENIDEIPFLGPLYFTRLPDGSRVFYATDVFSAIGNCGIISLCFGVCVFCGFKSYRSLNDASIQMSSRTRALSKQLFWTLFLQTLLPCCTQYLPVGLIFLFPLFEIDIGRGGNLVGVACSLYPAMDALIAIFMIDRFRNHLFGRKKVSSNSKLFKTYSSSTPIPN